MGTLITSIIGISVYEHPFLPVETTYDACDIVTKQEIKVYSGEFIYALTFNNKLFVSHEYYKEISKLPEIKSKN